MITALLTADSHLGVYYARLRPDRLELRRRALRDGFRRVVDAALQRRVDLFLHAGDLFDRPDPRNADRLFVAAQAARLQEAGIPFLAVAGNHDRPRALGHDGGVAVQEEMAALSALRLFRQTDRLEMESLLVRGRRVAVWGMSSDFNRPPGSCPLAECVSGHERGGDLDLVLLHCGVQGWAREDAREPCLWLESLSRLRTDAIGVGHLHARNRRRLPGGALLLNPGATEHLDFGEESQECGCWLLRLEPGRVEAEYLPLPAQPMRTLDLDLTGEETAGSLLEAVTARVEPHLREDLLLRVRLTGRVARPRFQELDLAALQAWGGDRAFLFQLEARDLVVYDRLRDLAFTTGVSLDVAGELRGIAEGCEEACRDDPTERELWALAGERATALYQELAGGAR